MWLAGGLAVSIACAFLYRFCAITQNIYLLHRKGVLICMFLLHVFYIAPAMLIDLYAMLHDYEQVLLDLKMVSILNVFGGGKIWGGKN
jgi:hypothetical protein